MAKTQIGQKPKLNVYTMMLVISFVTITVGCVVLLLELRRWGDGPRYWDTREVQVKEGG